MAVKEIKISEDKENLRKKIKMLLNKSTEKYSAHLEVVTEGEVQ